MSWNIASVLRFATVDFCSQNEINFAETIDRVGPDPDLHLAPGEGNVGMMGEFLGQGCHSIDMFQGTGKVRKLPVKTERRWAGMSSGPSLVCR